MIRIESSGVTTDAYGNETHWVNHAADSAEELAQAEADREFGQLFRETGCTHIFGGLGYAWEAYGPKWEPAHYGRTIIKDSTALDALRELKRNMEEARDGD